MFMYAILLYSGDGIEIDKKLATQIFKFLADKGYHDAILIHAGILYNGEEDIVNIDKKEAAKYYKLVADKDDGEIDAILKLASMYSTGDGVDVDKKQAAKYLKMVALKGNEDSMFKLGCMMVMELMLIKKKL